MHGHIYAINAIIHGEQDKDGMVLDFLEVKKTLKKFANELDHRVILPGKSDFVKVETADEVKVTVGDKRYVFPLTDVAVLDTPNTSAEELAKYLLNRFMSEVELNDRIREVSIGVDEGPAQGAWAKKEL